MIKPTTVLMEEYKKIRELGSENQTAVYKGEFCPIIKGLYETKNK